MKIEITNQQNLKRVNLTELKRYIGSTLKLLRLNRAELSVVVCDNAFITRINRKFLGKRCTTDVIAFGFNDQFNKNNLGEVIVSAQEASRQARKFRNTFKKELTLYVVHGILHLIGYDDMTKKERDIMAAKQSELLDKLFKG